MNCRKANDAIVAEGLGLLPESGLRALDRHAASCPRCAAGRHAEASWLRDLASLREAPPPSVDVRPAVLAHLDRAELSAPNDVSDAQLGWAALAAVTAIVLVVAGGLAWLPGSSTSLREAVSAGASLLALAGQLITASFALLAIPFKLLGGAADAVGALLSGLDHLQPAVVGVTIAAYVSMTGIIATVIGRDMRRPVTRLPQQEPFP